MVNHDELLTSLVLLVAWALVMSSLVLDWTPYRPLASAIHATFPKEAMMLDEQLLTEVALWSWVMFVLWAMQPDYKWDPYEAERKEDLMMEQRHGRYFAQELVLDQNANAREQIQDALDAGESQEWHLVGVSDVLSERDVILFWDTARRSFGRTSRS
jgi:hypothetical protein